MTSKRQPSCGPPLTRWRAGLASASSNAFSSRAGKGVRGETTTLRCAHGLPWILWSRITGL